MARANQVIQVNHGGNPTGKQLDAVIYSKMSCLYIHLSADDQAKNLIVSG